MSDNISPEEIKKRLVIFLGIPAEVWTDVLKLFSRRILVKKIAPACFRLKDICDKNVKSIHVIENADQFTDKLEKNDPETNKQLEDLADNKCQLSSQFKLTKMRINDKSKTILRHCINLFNGSQITLDIKEGNKNSKLFLESLDHLEGAKPAEISVIQRADQFIDYWHHPTFLKCTRVDLDFWPTLSEATMTTAFENIFHRLHHQPIEMDCDGAADQQVRCMIIYLSGHKHIEWLIDRCSEDIRQSKQLIDRRSYVFSFASYLDWPGFDQFRRIENKSTGEVLMLVRKVLANGQATERYRLRRCLAEEEANGAMFYAGTFKQGYAADIFDIGEKTTKVMIE